MIDDHRDASSNRNNVRAQQTADKLIMDAMIDTVDDGPGDLDHEMPQSSSPSSPSPSRSSGHGSSSSGSSGSSPSSGSSSDASSSCYSAPSSSSSSSSSSSRSSLPSTASARQPSSDPFVLMLTAEPTKASYDVDYQKHKALQLLVLNFDVNTLSQMLQMQGTSSMTWLNIANISRGGQEASLARHRIIEYLAMIHAIVLRYVRLSQPSGPQRNADDDADDRPKLAAAGGLPGVPPHLRPTPMNENVKLWIKTATEKHDMIRQYSK